MLFTEYYHSALRHLDVCKLMLHTLSSMKDKKQRLMLDIYYLSGYIIETMISYSCFVSIGWRKKDNIEKYSLYNKGFKTHKLSAKLTFATSKAYCDFSGIVLLGKSISNEVEKKMFNEWSEVVRYQSPKTCSKLDFTENDLRKYVNDIDLMFDKLSKKYYV